MNSLTVKKARKILGADASNVSDEQLEKDIETAALIKDLFFHKLAKDHNKTSFTSPNVP